VFDDRRAGQRRLGLAATDAIGLTLAAIALDEKYELPR
jgi:hypothetical protein